MNESAALNFFADDSPPLQKVVHKGETFFNYLMDAAKFTGRKGGKVFIERFFCQVHRLLSVHCFLHAATPPGSAEKPSKEK